MEVQEKSISSMSLKKEFSSGRITSIHESNAYLRQSSVQLCTAGKREKANDAALVNVPQAKTQQDKDWSSMKGLFIGYVNIHQFQKHSY